MRLGRIMLKEEEFIRPGTSHDLDFEAEDLNEPHRLNKAEFSNLVRDLDFLKQKVRAFGIKTTTMEFTLTRHQDYRVQDS
ncbi:hypothetical protein TNCT_435131 [Trichonephila clavata]|uniref:Uncharacterized protein n=1 Tax=Trichonephila clavata TaxID=2740835 RepID=A0A8X6GEQ6_TRICU|nr:hypothetical protein TNCT_435131 [Trichonephila clavata]